MGKKSAVRKYSDVEANAKIKQIRISPQKLNLVASLIRGMKASEALIQLQFSQKRVSKDIKSLLRR